MKTLIIAEAGVNHNGDIEMAKKLVASAASAGANDLLAEGAVVARDVADVLVAIGRGGTEGAAVPAVDPLADASVDQRTVLDALGVDPLALDEVLDRSGLPLERASAVLAELEDSQWVVRTGSWYQRCQPSRSKRGRRS